MTAYIFSCLSLILGLLWMYSVRNLILGGLRSYRWARTMGRIVDEKDSSFFALGLVGTAHTGIDFVKFPETKYFYEYEVGLNRYVSDMYCFGVHIDKEVAYYTVGERVSVYYNPANPRESVLRRGLQLGTMVSAVPVLAGAVALTWMLCT